MAVPDAMNRKDWKAYADLFADDADWINVMRMYWHGKENLVKAHAAYASTVFRNGGFRYSDMLVRGVAPNVAIVVVTEHADKEQIAPDYITKLPPGLGRISFVVVKRKGEWRITLGHNTILNKEAEKDDPISGGLPALVAKRGSLHGGIVHSRATTLTLQALRASNAHWQECLCYWTFSGAFGGQLGGVMPNCLA